MRATGSQTIVMEDAFVPDAAVSLRRPRGGFAPIFNIVAMVAMPFIAGVYVGIADRATEIALGLAQKRANDPTVQWSVGEMLSAAMIAGTCHDRAVALCDNFQFSPATELTSRVFMLKTHATEQAKKAVDRAMEAAGGAGFYRSSGLERLLRDVRAGHYHPLPEKQQMAFSGRLALGLDPIG
jgi:alkylation response protein AidB-like acyl-CoA dehydrogenase